MSISNGICGVANHLKYLKFTIPEEVKTRSSRVKTRVKFTSRKKQNVAYP